MALQSYKSLLEAGRQTPAEVRADLRRRVLDRAKVEERPTAERIMQEIFTTVEEDPVFSR